MRQGYQLSARHPTEGMIATFAEAESPSLGCQRCMEEFPPEEGYTEHRIRNFETKAEYFCKRKEPDSCS